MIEHQKEKTFKYMENRSENDMPFMGSNPLKVCKGLELVKT